MSQHPKICRRLNRWNNARPKNHLNQYNLNCMLSLHPYFIIKDLLTQFLNGGSTNQPLNRYITTHYSCITNNQALVPKLLGLLKIKGAFQS